MARVISNSKQIYIKRTEGEWKLIRNKLVPPPTGTNDKSELIYISMYIRRQVLKVKNRMEELPESTTFVKGELLAKRPYIDKSIYEDIKRLALQLGMSEEVFIDRLIITPLLQP